MGRSEQSTAQTEALLGRSKNSYNEEEAKPTVGFRSRGALGKSKGHNPAARRRKGRPQEGGETVEATEKGSRRRDWAREGWEGEETKKTNLEGATGTGLEEEGTTQARGGHRPISEMGWSGTNCDQPGCSSVSVCEKKKNGSKGKGTSNTAQHTAQHATTPNNQDNQKPTALGLRQPQHQTRACSFLVTVLGKVAVKGRKGACVVLLCGFGRWESAKAKGCCKGRCQGGRGGGKVRATLCGLVQWVERGGRGKT